jgi:hypothetical protein
VLCPHAPSGAYIDVEAAPYLGEHDVFGLRPERIGDTVRKPSTSTIRSNSSTLMRPLAALNGETHRSIFLGSETVSIALLARQREPMSVDRP